MRNRTQSKDYSPEAKELYTSFTSRHGLTFREEKNEYGDEFIIVPKQSNLSFEITLGLTGDDEANIGIEGFWSYIFPFPEKTDFLNQTLDGLIEGRYRVIEYAQFGRVTKRVIVNHIDEVAYTHHVGFKIPFFKESINSSLMNSKRKTP